MAFDNVEIELKFKVTDALFNRIRDHLRASATLKAQIKQVDHYFVPEPRNFLAEKYPFEWLSIRERSDKFTLNYKHFFPEGAEKHAYCTEYECGISNSSSMTRIFEALGIKCAVTVDKTREIFLLDDAEVALDSVVGLGAFVEIEAMRKHESINGTRQHLASIAEGLRLEPPEAARDYRGYPYLLWASKNAP